MPKKTTTKKLKAILLDLVLIYGKVKDTDKLGMWYCCTCSVFGRWDTMQWWHFMPQKKGLSTKFELDNVNLQCSGCNGRGNQWEQHKHWRYIDKRYYIWRADELTQQADKIRQWKIFELEEAIEDVENKLLDLCAKHWQERANILICYITKNSQRKANCRNLLARIDIEKKI